ncbi:MAG: hypothetical protein FJX22_02095 [Alphaproteobacteria bacterium]|nr:hypothetical protein [Alphaproteobacteria bacterium]
MLIFAPEAELPLRQQLGTYLSQLASHSHGSSHRFAALAIGQRGQDLVIGRGVNVKFAALDAIICAEMVAMASLIIQGAVLQRMFLFGPGESCGTCLQLMTEHPRLREKSVGEFAPAVQIDYFDGGGHWAKAENLEQLLPRPFLNSRRAAFRLAQNSPNLRQLLKAEQVWDLVQQPMAAMVALDDTQPAIRLLTKQAEQSGLGDRAILTGLLTHDGQLYSGVRLHPGGPYAASSVLTALATLITARGADTPLARVILLGGDFGGGVATDASKQPAEINTARHLLRAYQLRLGLNPHDLPVSLVNRLGQPLTEHGLGDLPLLVDR